MARRGGFNGGAIPGNMSNMLKQAQRMQRQMEEAQKTIEEKEFSASAGGGAVEARPHGNGTDGRHQAGLFAVGFFYAFF